ncbi:MAG: peptidase D-alanyl-D-alanine carboxypeptidase 1, partial [Verrucomicrobiaceae bacterium]|nr:peptidase D-alanyl-D-alanine carboxypeptidase 1 [Verrucomicrobiaceae bacterium]
MKSDERKAPEIAVAMGGRVTRLAALMNFITQRSGKVFKRIHAAVVTAAVAASVIIGGSARAQSVVMAVDTANRKVHVAGNANQKRAVGGLAKIATTMVVLDWSEASKVSLNVLATVPDYAERIAGQTYLGLQPGDKLTLRDLIYATMMGSDNVAAITLGHFVGGDLLARKGKAGDPLAEFVRNMNALAEREGCTNTQFMNPHGFENTRPLPYSTAADIARIALYATSRAPFH